MVQPRKLVFLAGAALAVLRHGRHAAQGHQAPGGILIGDAVLYDTLSRFLLGPFLARIAADVAAVAPQGARVLEVGCGPGRLSIRLARQHGLEVTGLDLDPAMIARAQANTDRAANRGGRRPSPQIASGLAPAWLQSRRCCDNDQFASQIARLSARASPSAPAKDIPEADEGLLLRGGQGV